MSIEYSNRVWSDSTLKNGDLLVMLALAHHADGNGECWPGMPLLIEKTRLTDRQIRRVLNVLDASGKIAIEQRAIGRGKKPHYKLFPCEKADNLSEKKEEEMSAIPDKSGNNVRLPEIKADILSDKSGHLLHGKADIGDTNYSHVRRESSLETPMKEREEEETRAGEPLSVAWQQAYRGIDMPPKLAKSLQELVIECGMAATIHGIKASAAKKDGRNFRYIAECARNYVPPPPIYNYANGVYHVDIPGVVQMAPTPQATAPPLPTPMAHDDPWEVALSELLPTLTPQAAKWLTGSRLSANGMLAGVPFYRLTVATEPDKVGWLKQQAEPAIRKKVSSIVGKRVEIEIVAAEMEPT